MTQFFTLDNHVLRSDFNDIILLERYQNVCLKKNNFNPFLCFCFGDKKICEKAKEIFEERRLLTQ